MFLICLSLGSQVQVHGVGLRSVLFKPTFFVCGAQIEAFGNGSILSAS